MISKREKLFFEYSMVKNIFKIFAIFLFGGVGGIIATQLLQPYFVERPVYINQKKEITIQENTALVLAVEKTGKSVIGVKSQTQEGIILEGSGLVVSSDGLIVTLADLVPQNAGSSFSVNGKSVSFQILKRDLKENLALVKINKSDLSTVSFADSNKTRLGERVFLVGVASSSLIVNEGIIRSFDENSIETNILENSNLAGSSLFNIEGQVLGLNTIENGRVISLPISKIKTFLGF